MTLDKNDFSDEEEYEECLKEIKRDEETYEVNINRENIMIIQLVEEFTHKYPNKFEKHFGSNCIIINIPANIEYSILTDKYCEEYVTEKHRTWRLE